LFWYRQPWLVLIAHVVGSFRTRIDCECGDGHLNILKVSEAEARAERLLLASGHVNLTFDRWVTSAPRSKKENSWRGETRSPSSRVSAAGRICRGAIFRSARSTVLAHAL
jgi:hypothetical protein